MKRLAGVAAIAVMLVALSTGTAFAQEGAPGIVIKENPVLVKVDGPGFKVHMTRKDLRVHIDEESFGIPEAGFPLQDLPPLDLTPFAANLRPFVCENGTYQLVSGTFDRIIRASSDEPRPLPYTPQFEAAFPQIFTFFGTVEGIVRNEEGEEFRLIMTDIAHEVLTEDSFSSTAPIHAFIVDSEGNVVDYASLVGTVNVDLATGEAEHQVVDSGTCHQTADLSGQFGPGSENAVVFGPFFVLPFNTTVVMG
jgi:hypothetical protein